MKPPRRKDTSSPLVTVSLGLPCIFLLGKAFGRGFQKRISERVGFRAFRSLGVSKVPQRLGTSDFGEMKVLLIWVLTQEPTS